MKKLSVFIGMVVSLLTVMSCQENQMEPFKNDPAIYFTRNDGQSDSINYSFFVLPSSVLRDTVYVRVYALGELADYDRPVKIVQTNVGKPQAAKAGVHYIPFDSPEVQKLFCIPAHKAYVDLPIIVLRDQSLISDEKRLELSVEKNEHFRVGIQEWSRFLVTISDLTTKPKLWDSIWKYYLGDSWGVVKMHFLIQSTGYTEWETVPSDYSYLVWLSATAKQALLDYNKAHPDQPLCEPNGDLVTMD